MKRCHVDPLPEFQVRFAIGDWEVLRWHHGPWYPRPFFYPVVGPSGKSLTRLGHPGTWHERHHRSLWFAHFKVQGQDFWTDRGPGRVVQRRWLVYQDGHQGAAMAVELGWQLETKELIRHRLIVVVHPWWVWQGVLEPREWVLELQSTLKPAPGQREIVLGQGRYGLLGLRVAKELSEHFGQGRLTDEQGRQGEKAILDHRAAWVDYSGPSRSGQPEGITCLDHPTNPGHPSAWIVRSNGWLGPSLCAQGPIKLTPEKPLEVRYWLFVHRGWAHPEQITRLAALVAHRPPWQVVRARRAHEEFALAGGE